MSIAPWASEADSASRSARGFTVAVVGAGGVIGSHLIPHLARNIEIDRLVLIDFDSYETKNLSSQAALPGEVGRPKAHVQAERARSIRQSLEVIGIAADVESLPVAWLRADIVLACLDSRRARQHVNLVTRRLGVPWLDAGVLGDQLLVRLDMFEADASAACLECGWSDADYAALEQRYPCDPHATIAQPSGSSSGLGALAAALQAIECGKQLSAEASRLEGGEQIVIDALTHNLWRTGRRQHAGCRIGSHEQWTTESIGDGPSALTLGGVFLRTRRVLAERATELDVASNMALRLKIEPQRFATEWVCEGCQTPHHDLRILGRSPTPGLPCPRCGATLNPLGLKLEDELDESRLTEADLDLRLDAIGVVSGDVLSVAALDQVLHFELAGALELAGAMERPRNECPSPCGWARDDAEVETSRPGDHFDVAGHTAEGESPHVA